MKEKITYWIGTALFAFLSVVTIVFFVDDIVLSVGVIGYYLMCLCLLIGAKFKLKPYEWLIFSIGMFTISIALMYNLHLLYSIIPLSLAFIIMLIIRIRKKENFERIILMFILEVLCGILVIAFGAIYQEAKLVENMPYKQEIVANIRVSNPNTSIITFEGSDKKFNISNDKAKLLRTGDTVYVKINNTVLHCIER